MNGDFKFSQGGGAAPFVVPLPKSSTFGFNDFAAQMQAAAGPSGGGLRGPSAPPNFAQSTFPNPNSNFKHATFQQPEQQQQQQRPTAASAPPPQQQQQKRPDTPFESGKYNIRRDVEIDVRSGQMDIGMLGHMVSFDRTKLSKTTILNSKSHINVLKRNEIPLTEESLTHNTVMMLDTLKDSHGKLLSMDYRRQIGMTIKRLYPRANIDLGVYSEVRRRKNKPNVFTSPESNAVHYVEAIKLVRNQCVSIMKTASERKSIDDLGMYDAAIAVLLTISTSLRIKELLQLRLDHIPDILANQRITIHSKSNKNVRSIAPNALLLRVFEAVQALRHLVAQNIKMKVNRNAEPQVKRFNAQYIIISSDDYMTKKLKHIAAMAGVRNALPTFGFNAFRRYITSALIEGGGHYVAQTMNNHSSVNTTLDHYNVVGPEAVQRAFGNLLNQKQDQK